MKKEMKHANVPVFIPHLGCPNQCVFCNQRTISGIGSFCEADAVRDIQRAVATVGSDRECEIAFFGGSFTGIDRQLMIRLLDTAEEYVGRGEAIGIRMSTRPDYITDEILDVLDRYTISQVELGLQSMSDAVLAASKRGHLSSDARRACALLKKRGYSFVGQMMIGLPKSTEEDEISTAKEICEMGAEGARVYPTIVFADTELADMAVKGEYVPLSVDEAVARTATVLKVFDAYDVPCLRVGLCDSENLHSSDTYVAGPNHSAIGELSRSRLFLEKICELLDKAALEGRDVKGREVKLFVPVGATSMAVGQKRTNVSFIKNKYGIKSVKVVEKTEIVRYNILLDII